MPHLLPAAALLLAIGPAYLSAKAYSWFEIVASSQIVQATSRDTVDLVEVPLDCYGQNAVIRLPSGFAKPQKQWYEEGYMLLLSYPDQSRITILCGSNAVLTIPKKARKGIRYRKEYCVRYGFTITYSRVPAGKVAAFDYAFDQLKKTGD